MEKTVKEGKRVFLYFFGFFAFIVVINTIFVYTALQTHSGTVTENAYEKGLSYNETLSAFRKQPRLNEKAVLDNGIFRWSIADQNGNPLPNATTKVTFFRSVKDGNDFDVDLTEKTPGIYEAQPTFPEKGLWIAQLDAKWKDRQYRTSQSIIVK